MRSTLRGELVHQRFDPGDVPQGDDHRLVEERARAVPEMI
jgi:hypothetical protein